MIKKSIFFFLLLINGVVATNAQLVSTNLPIIKITSTGAITGTQIEGTINIINNVTGVNNIADPASYTGVIGINTRAGLSANFTSKPSYNVETWVNNTGVSLDTSLLGMPTENDWVLLASYPDRSFARNILANTLYTNMGNYAPRMKLCEVLINNTYQGVYLFGEKIKRDTFRVDVAKLEPFEITDSVVTGGYIVKVLNNNNPDWTSSKMPFGATTQTTDFFIDYPDVALMPVQQTNYIKGYIDSFENALYGTSFQDTTVGWRHFAGEGTFIDYFIINEIAKNFDAYRNNFYMYKGKSKKLKPGTIWEMDQAFANTANCTVHKDTGFAYLLSQYCGTETELPVFWFEKLTHDTTFMKELKCRYKDLRTNILSVAKVNTTIDSIAAKLNVVNSGTTAQARNFALYPIFGVPTINEPIPMATNYAQEISNLKNYLLQRLTYLDTKWINTSPCFAVGTNNISKQTIQAIVYPNPATTSITIEIEGQVNEEKNIILYNYQGAKIKEVKMKKNTISIATRDIAKGIYFVQVKTNRGSKIIKCVIN